MNGENKFKIFLKIGVILLLAVFASFFLARAKLWAEKNYFFNSNNINQNSASKNSKEINEEDPTYISGLSRVYSFTPGAIDIESEDSGWIIPVINGPITAKEYLVIDLHSGAILENKDMDRVVSIASLTKLVTAEVSRQIMTANKEITITNSILSAYGSNGHLREEEVISASELLYPLLLVSSNDSAEALAQGYGRKDFIRAMNDWVRSIGAYHTDFYDPSGLSPYTISTARDQATILEWIYKNDHSLVDITGMRSATVRLHTWTNSTHFLNLSNYEGGKDGFIPQAGETAASLFSADANTAGTSSPSRYLVVVLGSQNRDNDVLSLLKKVKGK